MSGAEGGSWAGAPDELAAMLREVVDGLDDLVLVVDTAGFGLVFANRAAASAMRARGVEPAPGVRPLCVLAGGEDAAQRWGALLARAVREGPFTISDATGPGERRRELRLVPLRRDGAPFAVAVLVRDVEAQRRAEEASHQSEARFRAIFDASPFAIGVARAGTTVLVNPAYARLFGFADPDAAVGTPLTESLAPAVRATVVAQSRARLAGDPAPSEFDTIGLRQDGTEFPFHVNVIVFALPDGPASLGFFQDLTERRRAEEQRAAVEGRIRHAQQMEAIGTLAAGFAHDFNNVLAPILSLSQLALDEVTPGSATAEDLAVIHAAARRAQELVQHILLLSRGGEAASARRPIELGPLVKETVRLMRAAIPATVTVRAEVDPEPLAVAGDPTELHQVLLNLCMNARDAMAESGGSLTVGLRTARPGERPTATAEDAGWVLLTVKDTGCGMTPEIQRRIFEPYFTTKARGKGTGLGLSVTQGIVAALGGEVRVRSAPSHGSTFEVLLPKVGRPLGEPSLRPLLPRGQGERVLVVDDEPAIRMTLVRILRSLGYQPTEVATAGQVLTALRAAPRSFDALMVDQTMPGMTGVELAAACAALRADLPIVLCTGDPGVAVEVGAGPGQLRGLLRKPFTIEEVATVLRSALTP